MVKLCSALHSVCLALVVLSLPAVLSGRVSAGGIVVNEVLVNEPGSRVSLEWFELFNTSGVALSLLDDTLSINSQFVAMFGDITVAPSEFVVVTRDVVAFEERWGDSSGFWGDDTLLENYEIAQLAFSLTNLAGALSVSNDSLISSLAWNSAGDDGISWERVSSSGDSVAASGAALGATPGRINSVAPLTRDWEIVALDIVHEPRVGTRLEVTLRNAGALSLPGACVVVYDNPLLSSTAPFGISGDSLLCETFPELNPAESVTISVYVSLVGVYDTIGVAVAASDERPSNNIRIIIIPGSDFPPVQINEFLPNPQGDLMSEWVELKNISLLPVDLSGWRLGDELGFGEVDISNGATAIIQPGEYLLLAHLPQEVASFYRLTSVPPGVNSWRTLNNGGDVVRLQDPFGFAADSVVYEMVFGENVSWSRSEEPKSLGLWGRSALGGGTPNDSNTTLLGANASGLAVSVEPNPFSPDGDGFSETTRIDIVAPDGGNMSVTIYDIEGREIRRLFDGAPFSGGITWDGTSDSGQRVTIGIYIIYVEIENSASVKKTVVVAR
jgi:Lamin Tail Domain